MTRPSFRTGLIKRSEREIKLVDVDDIDLVRVHKCLLP